MIDNYVIYNYVTYNWTCNLRENGLKAALFESGRMNALVEMNNNGVERRVGLEIFSK